MREFMLVEAPHESGGKADFPVSKHTGWKAGVTGPTRFQVSMRTLLGITAFDDF